MRFIQKIGLRISSFTFAIDFDALKAAFPPHSNIKILTGMGNIGKIIFKGISNSASTIQPKGAYKALSNKQF